MVPNKKWIVNGVFVLAVILLVLTPVGFKIKVFASKLLSTSAAMVKEGNPCEFLGYLVPALCSRNA